MGWVDGRLFVGSGHSGELLCELALLACGAVSMNDARCGGLVDALDDDVVGFGSRSTVSGCDSGVKLLDRSLEFGAFHFVAQRLDLCHLYTLFGGFDVRQTSIPSFP